jgi:hypothetical protein
VKTGAVVVIGVPMQVVDGRGDGADETADGLIRCLPHSQGNERHELSSRYGREAYRINLHPADSEEGLRVFNIRSHGIPASTSADPPSSP